ncbi:MAG: PHP domain-containing protein [Fibrobacteria bacterium]|nr:PHP domain-containing protein [Fibrobacteria bacterium]
MIKNDLHVHSIRSACGMHTILEIVQIAVSKGMHMLNISDHGHALDRSTNFSILADKRRLPNPVRYLGNEEIWIVRGMEANILDFEGNTDIEDKFIPKLDLINLGFHETENYHLGNSEAKNTQCLVNTLAHNPLDIITHPCIKTFPLDIEELVTLSLQYGFAIEVNNTNLRLEKTNLKKLEKLIPLALEKGALLAENSDGHTYYEIGENEKITALMNDLQIDGDKAFFNRDDKKVMAFIADRKSRRNALDTGL